MKTLATILVVILMGLLPATGNAVCYPPHYFPGAIEVRVGSVWFMQDGPPPYYIDVPVWVSNMTANHGVIGAKFTVEYNEDKLELLEIIANPRWEVFSANLNPNKPINCLSSGWDVNDNATGLGIMVDPSVVFLAPLETDVWANLRFRIKEDDPNFEWDTGTMLSVSCACTWPNGTAPSEIVWEDGVSEFWGYWVMHEACVVFDALPYSQNFPTNVCPGCGGTNPPECDYDPEVCKGNCNVVVEPKVHAGRSWSKIKGLYR